ncbi:MAG TPA: kelch repeat-containing protein, partial [bacterium]|nr:kelch repeat-containing protein [bacterium]
EDDGVLGDLYRFDPSSLHSWLITSVTSPPRMFAHGAAAKSVTEMLIYGGYRVTEDSEAEASRLWVYDATASLWSSSRFVSSVTNLWNYFPGIQYFEESDAAYITGGMYTDSPLDYQPEIRTATEMYAIQMTNLFRRLDWKNKQLESRATKPGLASLGSYTAMNNGTLYVYGGVAPCGSPLADLWYYNTTYNYWMMGNQNPTIIPRSFGTVQSLTDTLFVSGGYKYNIGAAPSLQATDVPTGETWLYNTKTSAWTRCADGPPLTYAQSALVKVNGQDVIILFGGILNGAPNSAFYVYYFGDTPPYQDQPTPTPTPTTRPGDYDADGFVDSRDLSRLVEKFAASSPEVDLNGDGKVDALDLFLFSLNWEPTTGG